MKIAKTKKETREIISEWKKQGHSVGFVPTMGFLHQGHLSLVDLSLKKTDKTVVSIFVNPTQFGPSEDFEKYPRNMDRDLRLLKELGTHLVFAPDAKQMYPEPQKAWVEVEGLSENLCGKSRPGHFRGVATVVAKLLNIVQPDIAIFGQKDFQQVQVIKKMVKDLDIPVEIVMAPIVREKDGLAMSSRNTYLSPDERKSAVCLYKALLLAKELIIKKSENNTSKIKDAIANLINSYSHTKIDYIFIGDPESLEEKDTISRPVLVALAVFVGTTRLIDNELIG